MGEEGIAPELREGRRCPSCGVPALESARYCTGCGRPFADTAPAADIGGWIQAGWKLFVGNIPTAIGIPLVTIIPTMFFFVLGYFGMVGLVILSGEESAPPRIASIVLAAIMGTGAMLLALTMPALQGGVYACFLDGIRTGKLRADRFWTGFRHWWACTWVVWSVFAAMVLCLPFTLILIGIPVLLCLSTLAWIALFRIVDKGKGGMEAISFACEVMRGRLWMLVLYTFLVSLLKGAGVWAMYLGVVVTVPIGVAALAAGYDSLSKKQDLQPDP